MERSMGMPASVKAFCGRKGKRGERKEEVSHRNPSLDGRVVPRASYLDVLQVLVLLHVLLLLAFQHVLVLLPYRADGVLDPLFLLLFWGGGGGGYECT